MTAATPRTVEDYLDLLRAELQGADRALVQDALYDAEEHLRAELAQHPETTEETMLGRIVASYGAPSEVADAYRSNETRVQAALRTPPPKPKHTTLGRFFGVYSDPHAYLSMAYMLLALATGIFYFTFAVTGLSLSAGFAILIIGIPFSCCSSAPRACSRWRRAASWKHCWAPACRAGPCIPVRRWAGCSACSKC